MRIEWINHASVLLHSGPVTLVTDPWLLGTAFDDGWSLLSPTPFQPSDFDRVTHVWLSHEHPDHFSPATLRAIPEGTRANLTVLYQQTRDRKVVEFCRELGFGTVQELPHGDWVELAPGFRLLCQPFPDDDSWLAVEADHQLVLNLNDCVVREERHARAIAAHIARPIDVLLTQFSFAQWVGNPDDPASHRRHAAEQLDRVVMQCQVLQPRFVIPFASFVWFSHEENAYLNGGMNTARDAVAAILDRTNTPPVVLYPGDQWEVGEPHDPGPALARYDADYARLHETPELHADPSVALADLSGRAEDFVARLRKQNGSLLSRGLTLAGQVRPAHIWLTDHDVAVALALDRGLRRSARPRHECDVALSSDALAYCFENLWGGNTLLVNGRFSVPPGGHFERFRRYLTLADLANHGKTAWHYGAYRLGDAAAGVRDRLRSA